MTTAANKAPVLRTSAGLRDAIFDEIDAVRSGKSNPARANAVAKLAGGIIDSVRMEVEVHRHLQVQGKGESAHPTEGPLGAALQLSAQSEAA